MFPRQALLPTFAAEDRDSHFGICVCMQCSTGIEVYYVSNQLTSDMLKSLESLAVARLEGALPVLPTDVVILSLGNPYQPQNDAMSMAVC